MNQVCHSCGKEVPPEAAFCPHCGAPQQQEPTAPRSTSAPATTASEPSELQRTCPECGAVNAPGADTCSVCGESLLRAPVPTGTQTRQTGPEAGEGDRSSATKSYLLAGVIVLAISAAIYLLTVPDQGPAGLQHGAMQPPQQQQGENLPPGHPPTNQGPTPEQQRMISELRGKLAANPNDEEAKLQLANALYDANQHEEALPLYRDYVKNHPENEDARTDMAYSMYQTGDLEGAIAELRTITSQAGKHQNAAYNLAMMYVVKRNRDSVQYWMERVIEIDSTTTQAKNAREIMQALSEAHPGETVPPAGN